KWFSFAVGVSRLVSVLSARVRRSTGPCEEFATRSFWMVSAAKVRSTVDVKKAVSSFGRKHGLRELAETGCRILQKIQDWSVTTHSLIECRMMATFASPPNW